jgi:transposase
MPRPSTRPIVIEADEHVVLERRAREVTASWREIQRAQIVLYAAEGMRDIDIATRLDCHPEIVSRWRRRFLKEGRVDGLADRPHTGRPRRFPPE